MPCLVELLCFTYREAAKRKHDLDSQGGVPFAVINGIGVHGYAPEKYGQALQ
jgi:hypothetical protein